MRVRWWVDGETTPRLAALIAEPDSVLGGPGSLARESAGRKRLYRVAGAADEAALFVKLFTLPPGPGRLRYLLGPSKARREAAVAKQVAALGFEVAAPLAVGEQRRLGLLERSFSVIRELPAQDLRTVLRDPGLSRKERRGLLERFARFARRLHDAGVDQDDFSTNNFLVLGGGGFALIDFERCRVTGASLGARRYTLLAKLARREALSRADRLRFVSAYLGNDSSRATRRGACTSLGEELRRIRQRDARHARAAAFKLGRHVGRERSSWVVVARRDARMLRLELAPERAREAWVRAFQLERLGLPALRPARLDPGAVSLELPEDCAPADAAAEPDEATRRAHIARSRRMLELYGRFTREPDWVITRKEALLRDPLAFELDL